jgi:hypothetical protein
MGGLRLDGLGSRGLRCTGKARKEASMRLILVLVALLPGLGAASAQAEGWEDLDGPAVAAALSARVLGYPDGTLQDFFADGRTLYGESWGRWEVRDGRYCSLWPPSDRWTCHEVDRNGLDIRFTAEDGTETIGRYVDLQ